MIEWQKKTAATTTTWKDQTQYKNCANQFVASKIPAQQSRSPVIIAHSRKCFNLFIARLFGCSAARRHSGSAAKEVIKRTEKWYGSWWSSFGSKKVLPHKRQKKSEKKSVDFCENGKRWPQTMRFIWNYFDPLNQTAANETLIIRGCREKLCWINTALCAAQSFGRSGNCKAHQRVTKWVRGERGRKSVKKDLRL